MAVFLFATGGVIFGAGYASSDQFFTKVNSLHGGSLWQCIGFSIAILGITIGIGAVIADRCTLFSSRNKNNLNRYDKNAEIPTAPPLDDNNKGDELENEYNGIMSQQQEKTMTLM